VQPSQPSPSPSLSRLGVTCRLQERNYQTKDR
jgi:hypothetical protein